MKYFRNCLNFSSIPLIAFLFLSFIYISSFAVNYKAYKTTTAPVVDGVGDEYCWIGAQWALINQPFDGLSLPDSSDFYGRYKAVWTSSRVYILMEITDNKLVDNRVNPSDNYWEDDLTEFFIDEDHQNQGHECGADAFNAFAYHIAAVARDKNNYTNGSIVALDSPDASHHVIDLGTDCNTGRALNLDDHVKVKIVKNGNKYTWELEFKIYNKSYDQNSLTNTPVTLNANKVMGFSIAYCDDDNGKRESMVGTVPNHNDYSGKYPFYRYTNEFGTLTLNDSVMSPTSAIDKKLNSLKIALSPNPVGNTLTIKILDNFNQFRPINPIKIINMTGQTVHKQIIEESDLSIDVSQLTTGIYILETTISGKLFQQKFIKE